MARAPTSARITRDRLVVLLFLGALAAPWADELVRTDEARGPLAREHRMPSSKPALVLEPRALHKFPSTYEAYFKDTFGLRDRLLRWHALQSLDLFGVSPTDQVLIGKDGWYFYTGNDSVRAWRGLVPFSEEDLRQWKLGLEARRDWLRDLGMEYLFVIAPNKETIYPDYYPDTFAKLGPTRLEQFADYMARNSDLDFLDLRGPFAEERKHDGPQNHVYLEEGTHWNARGALVAYHEILARLARKNAVVAPLPYEAWQRVSYETSNDTWASNMYIGDLSRQREVGLMRLPGMTRSRTLNEGFQGVFGPGRKLLRGTDDASLPRALMFHDSFGPFIENLLSEHFSRIEYEWSYAFDSTEVQALMPNIVIELWVERAFMYLDPRSFAPPPPDLPEAAFARAQTICLKLDPEASPQSECEPLAKIQVESTRDDHGPAYRLLTNSAADSVLLPPLSGPPLDRPLVHISIDAPQKGRLDLLYLRSGDADYRGRQNCPIALEQGPNEVYLRIPNNRITGRLRLRPAHSTEGAYLLHSFEVRAGPGT